MAKNSLTFKVYRKHIKTFTNIRLEGLEIVLILTYYLHFLTLLSN